MNLLNFSPWTSWEKREELNALNYPGVYAIAISLESLLNRPFSLIDQIVYFGMTNSASGLRGRLRQFHNTINGKRGHGGAERFLFKHKSYSELRGKLFVSVNSEICDVRSNESEDLCKMGDIAKFEYVCLAEYRKKFGRLPEFNDKKLSPKRQSIYKRT